MTDIDQEFKQAVEDSNTLDDKPDNRTLLRLYALYKQASVGDVAGERPAFIDLVGRAKWDAWNELKGRPRHAVMQDYIDLVESLK